jgi:signal transduction histidine kinase/CheY-like chemotaxis protein
LATVLVVDDRAVNRELVRTLLTVHGYDSIEASDGEEALSILDTVHPDLVIADVLMPGIDGYEMVREMRADPRTSQIPVVFYTANYQQDEARPIAEAVGVSRIIAKSGDTAELMTAVAEALDAATSAAVSEPGRGQGESRIDFGREHLRMLKAKLVERTDELEDRRKMERVIEAAMAVSEEISLELTLQRLVAGAKNLLKAAHAVVAVFDEGGTGAVVRTVPAEAPPPTADVIEAPLYSHGYEFGMLRVFGRAGGGRFDREERDLLDILAVTTAPSIRNAQLYDDAVRREAWLRVSAEVTTKILAAESSGALAAIASGVRAVAHAYTVWIEVDTGDGQVRIEACDGELAGEYLHRTVSVADAPLYQEVSSGGLPVAITDAAHEAQWGGRSDIGPALAVPLQGTARCLGAMVIARAPGAASFGRIDVEMASAFAGQAALALEYARALAVRETAILAEDRDRIARDLHDVVIQQIFTVGLRLDSVRARVPDPQADQIAVATGELDDAVRKLRGAIYLMREHREGTLRAELDEVLARATVNLGFRPALRVDGPVDVVVTPEISFDLIATVSEALSNAARHAGASRVEVDLSAAEGTLTLQVADDGVGIAPSGRQSGLANMARRAEALGGSMQVRAGLSGRGVTLVWQVPY